MYAMPTAVWRRLAQPIRGSRMRCTWWNWLQALRHKTPDTPVCIATWRPCSEYTCKQIYRCMPCHAMLSQDHKHMSLGHL